MKNFIPALYMRINAFLARLPSIHRRFAACLLFVDRDFKADDNAERSEWLPSAPLCHVDFFTPNGIPLLFVDTNRQGGQEEHFVQTATGRTKTLSAIFEQSRNGLELPAATKYADALARFAYAEQHGILADARILNGL